MWVDTETMCLIDPGPADWREAGTNHHRSEETGAQSSFVHPVSVFVKNILYK